MIRTCNACQGSVTSSHESFQIEHLARDERGRFIYETVVDKKTGERSERAVTFKVTGRGLGHWTCDNRCPKRKGVRLHHVDSNNSGKENERNLHGSPLPTRRDILVITSGKRVAVGEAL